MSRRFALGAVLLCLGMPGCSNNELLIRKQVEIDARLEQLVQAHAEADSLLAELKNNIRDLQSQVKVNAADLEELKPGFRELKSSLEVLSSQSGGEGRTTAASRIVVVNKAASGENDSVEQDAYMKAFGLFSANDYGAAVSSFEAFIAAYPASEYAINAQYWIGECFYTQRDYTKAIHAFTKVVEHYPNGKKVPDAMLKLGFSLISLGQQDKARNALELLVEKFPKSQAAAKARERLSRN